MRTELLAKTNLEGGVLLEECESSLSTNYDEIFRKPLLALTNGVCKPFRFMFDCFDLVTLCSTKTTCVYSGRSRD